LPLEVGVHDKVVELVEKQPAGRLAYEYDKPPYPPLVETVNVTFSPAKRLAGEAMKAVIEGSEPTVTSIEYAAIAPRVSVTVQTTVIAPVVA